MIARQSGACTRHQAAPESADSRQIAPESRPKIPPWDNFLKKGSRLGGSLAASAMPNF
jgi:hypothetical protein